MLMRKQEGLAAGWVSPRAVLLVSPGFPKDPWASPGPLDRSHWVESGEQYLTCPPGLYSWECEERGLAKSLGEGAEARSRPGPQGRAQTGPWASFLPVAKRAILDGTGLQTALPNFVGTLRKKLLASEGHRAPVSVAPPSGCWWSGSGHTGHHSSQAPPSICFRTQGLTPLIKFSAANLHVHLLCPHPGWLRAPAQQPP